MCFGFETSEILDYSLKKAQIIFFKKKKKLNTIFEVVKRLR